MALNDIAAPIPATKGGLASYLSPLDRVIGVVVQSDVRN